MKRLSFSLQRHFGCFFQIRERVSELVVHEACIIYIVVVAYLV